jgi:protocatechuate 3,4-dioxygenase beta subunit
MVAQEPLETRGAPAAPTETASVQGAVVAAASGEPLRGAKVVLIQADARQLQNFSQPQNFGATTDSEGHFVIPDVPAGRYMFRASKNGYVAQAYHPEAGGAEAILELGRGQKLEKAFFSLKRAAVIIGRITDENGEAIPGVTVEAIVARSKLHARQSGVKSGALPVRSALTNDLGEYRLFNLPAGSYYVAAVNTGVSQFIGESGGWTSVSLVGGSVGDPNTRRPPLYYPGVSQRSQAEEVRVGGGQEARVDMSLRPEKTVTVSGWVVDPAGKAAPQAMVSMRVQNLEEVLSLQVPEMTDAQGKFEIKGVTPGSYVLSATAYQKEGKSYAAEQPIEVAGESVRSVRLQLFGGVNIRGQLTVSRGANADLSQTWVYLFRSDGAGASAASEIKDGALNFQDVHPGTYSLTFTNLPDGWYVSSAMFGSANVLETGLQIGEGANRQTLQITIRRGTGRIEGVVTTGGDPVPGAVIKLGPETAGVYRPELDRSVTADQRGHYVLENVEPGNYRLLAIKGTSDGEDDDDSAADVSSGVKIAVAEAESKILQLKLTAHER